MNPNSVEENFRGKNHYVSCGYLKRWESSHKKLWIYRILVPHDKMPLWKEGSVSGVAFQTHLYTRLIAGKESDEIEKWFAREYETPAEEPIQKATSDARLTPSDWRILVRFLAAQDVRTPARLIEGLQNWQTILPDILENTLQETVQKLEALSLRGEKLKDTRSPLAEYLPLRIKTEIEPGQELCTLKAETIVGRSTWLFSIRHLLTNTAKILHQHRWTILSPPNGMTWFTSDVPVIRLNFHSSEKYDFNGGWGSKGTEIFLPLSPYHLLYTKVGYHPPARGSKFLRNHAELIRRFIAEHAHRMIFSQNQDADIPKLRPRIINNDLLRSEKERWDKWHEEQKKAEKDLMV